MELTNHNKKKRKSSEDISAMGYGKIPPQAKDIEVAILGTILLDNMAFDTVNELLSEECFYVDAHQKIFSAMKALAQRSNPIDILTTQEELRSRGDLENVGGPYYLVKMTNDVVSSANLVFHCRIVYRKYIQRQFILEGSRLIESGYEETNEVFDALDQAEKGILQLSSKITNRGVREASSILVETIKRIEVIRQTPDRLTGVPSGYPSIDKLTHGWQPSDLIILAARPSVGKTALALNLARNAIFSDYKIPTAFFSLEMSSGQLMERLISMESEISLDRIKKGRLNEGDMKTIYDRAVKKIGVSPFYIDDTAYMNIFELKSKARLLKKKKNVGLIIIDYLQLMNGITNDTRNREQEISNITRNLKALAKELKIPVIALSQLSRAVETRGGEKMPQLSDLRESGAIEQDADIVAFIYRPEYYGIQKDDLGASTPGETSIRFAKNRNGSLDTIKLRANLWIQKFYEDRDLPNLPSNDYKSLAAGENLTGPVINNDKEKLPF